MLEHLCGVLNMLSEDIWSEHFMVILPMLYDLLHTEGLGQSSEITAGTLKCFATLLRLQPDRMREFPELIIVSLLEVQRDMTTTVSQIKSQLDSSETFC